MKPCIFVVDPEAERSALARAVLEQAGYTVQVFATAHVLEMAQRELPALMLIALNLPDGNGVDIIRGIRSCSSLRKTRVIMLGEDWEVADYAAAQSHAASDYRVDDCITAPFTPTSLLSRVKAVLQSQTAAVLQETAEIVIDSSAMKLKVRGNEIPTTTLEFRLIDYMARHRGKVFTRDALLDAVWGDLRFVTPRSVDACVGRIRRKIEHNSTSPTYLKTMRGIGYRLDATAIWEAPSPEFCQCLSCTLSRARSKARPRPSARRFGT